MRILISTLTPAYLRHFEPVVRELAARGHDVHLGVHQPSKGGGGLEMQLAGMSPRVEAGRAPTPRDDWHQLSLGLRACRDYLQFASPTYNERYRARAEERVPEPFRRLMGHRGARSRTGHRVFNAAVLVAERLVPTSAEVERYLVDKAPDALLLTPYVGLRTVQPDYLRAARRLGIPCGVCVASWDNLSSKSLLRPQPDLLTVWNETQREEAVALHGLQGDRVAVTGAQCFDHWFGWPARDRAEFCARAGLDPHRPYLLYTCFSPFKGEPSEPRFVREWLGRLRADPDPDLAGASVLIRPHPKRGAEWRDVDLADLGPVSVWPAQGAMVVGDEARADFFDSLHHSAAVVGLNTSAMIEAGIVGRPVHTLLVPRFHHSQEGTLHFRYLLEVGGGLLRVARGWDEHMAQLRVSVARAGMEDEQAQRFVRQFVRPHGLDVAATPLFVDVVERLAARRLRKPVVTRLTDPLLRVVARPAARAVARAAHRDAEVRKAAAKRRAAGVSPAREEADRR